MTFLSARDRFSVVVFFMALAVASCSPGDNSGDNVNAVREPEEGFSRIFDGKTLRNWEGDSSLWRVENGNLVGEITPGKELKTNSFLIWRGSMTQDFELKTEFRISENGNSGINYRSEPLPDVEHALRGYQADIDGKNNYTGQNYEERGRTTLAYQGEKVIVSSAPDAGQDGSLRANVKNNAWTIREVTEKLGSQDSLRSLIKGNDWNTCRIVAQGNRLQHYINGTLVSDVTDNDTANRRMNGLLGVQVHVGPPMKVEYRNIWFKQL